MIRFSIYTGDLGKYTLKVLLSCVPNPFAIRKMLNMHVILTPIRHARDLNKERLESAKLCRDTTQPRTTVFASHMSPHSAYTGIRRSNSLNPQERQDSFSAFELTDPLLPKLLKSSGPLEEFEHFKHPRTCGNGYCQHHYLRSHLSSETLGSLHIRLHPRAPRWAHVGRFLFLSKNPFKPYLPINQYSTDET